jgi:hypothetical protein
MLGDKPSTAKTNVLSVAERRVLCSQFGQTVTNIAIAAVTLDQPSHAQIA